MNRCPPPLRLERSFVEPDRAVERHMQTCATCRAARDDYDDLRDALNDLPYAPMTDRTSDAIRVGLIGAVRATRQKPRIAWAPWVVAASAAATFAVWFAVGARDRRATPEPAVPTSPLARTAPTPKTTTVELRDGTPVFEVPALDVSSIVVRTIDFDVEAHVARFRAVATDGVLERIEILSGEVTLRPKKGGDPTVLTAGEVWRAEPTVERVEAERPVVPRSEPVRPKSAPPPVAPEIPVAEPEPDDVSLFSQGWSAFRRGDYGEAVTHFDRVARTDGPFAEDAGFWCAVAELRRGNEQQAIVRLDAFLRSHPDSARADEAVRLLSKLRR